MYKGVGDPWIRTTDKTGSAANNQRMMVLGLLSFAVNAESNTKESSKFNSNGELVTASKVKGSTSYTLQLSMNEIDWGLEGFLAGQFPRTATNVPIPSLTYDDVPTAAAYEITDSYVTAANDDEITVVITESGTWGQAGQTLTHAATPASPGAGEVGVDVTNGKLIFNAAQAGAPIAYPKFTTYTSVQDVGGPSGADTWGRFQFWGKIFVPSISNGEILYIPDAEIASEPSWTIDDGVPTVTIDCSMNTPTGWNKPYRKFNMSTAVA